jgi:hypothetical protein
LLHSSGIDNIQLKATDPSENFKLATFILNIEAVNDSPIINIEHNIIIKKNEAKSFKLSNHVYDNIVFYINYWGIIYSFYIKNKGS